MSNRLPLVVAVMAFFFASAFGVPAAPENVNAEFDPNGIFISWSHESVGSVSFDIYRGPTADNTRKIASIGETSFLDQDFKRGEEYWYYITPVDETGPGRAAKFSVTVPKPTEKPFTVELLEPEKKTFSFGEKVGFAVAVESPYFPELEGLEAVLVSDQLSLEKEMSFDSVKRVFFASVQMPEAGQAEEGFSADFEVLVSAFFDGSTYEELLSGQIALVPVKPVDTGQLASNILAVFGPILLLLMVASTVAFVGWKYGLQRKARLEDLKLKRLEIDKERLLWRREAFKRKITGEQFKEKEAELQAGIQALEQKMGGKKGESHLKKNVFEGFSPQEAEQAVRLVKSIGKPKEHETLESLRARLVGLGHSDKVAKKVAELVFQ